MRSQARTTVQRQLPKAWARPRHQSNRRRTSNRPHQQKNLPGQPSSTGFGSTNATAPLPASGTSGPDPANHTAAKSNQATAPAALAPTLPTTPGVFSAKPSASPFNYGGNFG